AVPPDPSRPFAPVLAGGGGTLPRLARGTRLLPCRGPAVEGGAAGSAGLSRWLSGRRRDLRSWMTGTVPEAGRAASGPLVHAFPGRSPCPACHAPYLPACSPSSPADCLPASCCPVASAPPTA